MFVPPEAACVSFVASPPTTATSLRQDTPRCSIAATSRPRWAWEGFVTSVLLSSAPGSHFKGLQPDQEVWLPWCRKGGQWPSGISMALSTAARRNARVAAPEAMEKLRAEVLDRAAGKFYGATPWCRQAASYLWRSIRRHPPPTDEGGTRSRCTAAT